MIFLYKTLLRSFPDNSSGWRFVLLNFDSTFSCFRLFVGLMGIQYAGGHLQELQAAIKVLSLQGQDSLLKKSEIEFFCSQLGTFYGDFTFFLLTWMRPWSKILDETLLKKSEIEFFFVAKLGTFYGDFTFFLLTLMRPWSKILDKTLLKKSEIEYFLAKLGTFFWRFHFFSLIYITEFCTLLQQIQIHFESFDKMTYLPFLFFILANI